MHTPERNGMVERLIRSLKERCVRRHHFEILQPVASSATGPASTTTGDLGKAP